MASKGVKKRKGAIGGPVVSEEERRIRELEEGVYSSSANANNIVDLLELCQSEDGKVVHSATHALHRVFVKFMETGELTQLKTKKLKTKGSEDARATYRKWLHSQYLDFIKLLLGNMAHSHTAVQVSALQMLMAFVEAEALKLTQTAQHIFPNTLFQRIVTALLDNENFNDELLDVFVSNYLNKYDDVRYYTYKNITSMLAAEASGQKVRSRKQSEQLSVRVFAMLRHINFPTVQEELDVFLAPLKDDEGGSDEFSDEDVDEGEGEQKAGQKRKHGAAAAADSKAAKALLSLTAHKHVFSDCWLALLRRPLSDEIYKRVLVLMHKEILPHLVNPKLLIDFLVESYNRGGVISVLALNGLFILITEHNLDYPDFYKKLYALFDNQMFYVKYRDRFFHLSNIFLKSPLLPSYLVAAFIKRTMRLAIHAPPSAVAYVMPFVYNMLLRHPQCMPMIHRERSQGDDPFAMDEPDPMKCNALESSLWELDALQQHYSPSLAKFSNVFFNVFQKKEFDVDEFLAQDYSNFFTTEIERKLKDAALEFNKPTGLLGDAMAAEWTL